VGDTNYMYQDKGKFVQKLFTNCTPPHPPKGNKTLMHTFVVFCGVAGSTWGGDIARGSSMRSGRCKLGGT